MISKPKYKIARRLGPEIFEKTQTKKFATREARKSQPFLLKHGRSRSDYGTALLEKQKARYLYGIGERQFARYVASVSGKGKSSTPEEKFFCQLENRIDNTVYRLGFARTRREARQLVSHRHIILDGKVVKSPSYSVSVGDKLGIRSGSLSKPAFSGLFEKIKEHKPPSWLRLDLDKREGEVVGMPVFSREALPFSIEKIIELYRR